MAYRSVGSGLPAPGRSTGGGRLSPGLSRSFSLSASATLPSCRSGYWPGFTVPTLGRSSTGSGGRLPGVSGRSFEFVISISAMAFRGPVALHSIVRSKKTKADRARSPSPMGACCTQSGARAQLNARCHPGKSKSFQPDVASAHRGGGSARPKERPPRVNIRKCFLGDGFVQ